MDFIEQLKSLGGVKPCSCDTGFMGPKIDGYDPACPDCHGTGKIIDLAPLLAKPDVLSPIVVTLLHEMVRVTGGTLSSGNSGWLPVRWKEKPDNLIIIGPQRTAIFGYEIARQLGGTAVAVEPVRTTFVGHPAVPESTEDMMRWTQSESTSYNLSVPIPPDATVLFVTDKINKNHTAEPIVDIIRTVASDAIFKKSSGQEPPFTVIPRVLALVSRACELDLHIDGIYFQVISLHDGKL